MHGSNAASWLVRNKNPNTKNISALIKAGVDLNQYDRRHFNTPLIYAADSKHSLEVFKVLVEGGADVNHRNFYGDNIISLLMTREELGMFVFLSLRRCEKEAKQGDP